MVSDIHQRGLTVALYMPSMRLHVYCLICKEGTQKIVYILHNLHNLIRDLHFETCIDLPFYHTLCVILHFSRLIEPNANLAVSSAVSEGLVWHEASFGRRFAVCQTSFCLCLYPTFGIINKNFLFNFHVSKSFCLCLLSTTWPELWPGLSHVPAHGGRLSAWFPTAGFQLLQCESTTTQVQSSLSQSLSIKMLLSCNNLYSLVKELKSDSNKSIYDQRCFLLPVCSAFNPSWLFWCELQSFGDIGRRDVCLLSNKKELDGTWLVVFRKAKWIHLWAVSWRN